MLGKLLKHEFRATGRIMLPLFGILLLVSVGANFSIRGMADSDNTLLRTLGVILIMLFIIAIAAVLGNVSELTAVKNAFAGIRVGVAVLMINSVVKLAKAAIVDWKAVIIFAAVFGGAVFTSVSPMIYIVAAGIAGILLKAWEVKAK